MKYILTILVSIFMCSNTTFAQQMGGEGFDPPPQGAAYEDCEQQIYYIEGEEGKRIYLIACPDFISVRLEGEKGGFWYIENIYTIDY